MTEPKRVVTHVEASKLLHNKFVVVLGDSIQRAVYKDVVLLLQEEKYLTQSQLRTKGEMSFAQDCLVEGGSRGHMNNGTEYREVRQFRSDHHLVRFYFLTRIYSRYMKSVLEDFRTGLKPDVLVINSCVWDISRYGPRWVEEYRENLHRFFEHLDSVLDRDCLVVWNVTMPLGKKIIGGFLVPEIAHLSDTIRYDVIEANFYAARLANAYGLDVLDLHYQFRYSLQHRTKDGVHWNALAHRRITSLLLQHAAGAWGVDMPCPVINIEKIDPAGQQAYESFAKSVEQIDFAGQQAYESAMTQEARGTALWSQAPPTRLYREAERDAYANDLPPAIGYFSFEAYRQEAGNGAAARGAAGGADRDAPSHRRTRRDGHRNSMGGYHTGQSAYHDASRSPNQYVMRNRNARKAFAPYNQRPPHNHHQNHCDRQYHPYPRY